MRGDVSEAEGGGGRRTTAVAATAATTSIGAATHVHRKHANTRIRHTAITTATLGQDHEHEATGLARHRSQARPCTHSPVAHACCRVQLLQFFVEDAYAAIAVYHNKRRDVLGDAQGIHISRELHFDGIFKRRIPFRPTKQSRSVLNCKQFAPNSMLHSSCCESIVATGASQPRSDDTLVIRGMDLDAALGGGDEKVALATRRSTCPAHAYHIYATW